MEQEMKKKESTNQVQEQKDHRSILERTYNQIKNIHLSIPGLVKDTTVGEHIWLIGIVFSLFVLLFGWLFKPLIKSLVSFVFRFVFTVCKQSWIIVKAVIILVTILVITMVILYSTALITLLAKTK